MKKPTSLHTAAEPPAASQEPPADRCFRQIPLTICIFLLLAGMFASIVSAKEPAKKAADAEPSPEKQLEGLGFTSAPQEGGKGHTVLFGLVGEGYKFVYVIDRSGSMGGDGRQALRRAKAELIRSLKQLDKVHQFQSSSTTSGRSFSIRRAQPADWPSPLTKTRSGRSGSSIRSRPTAARRTRTPCGWPFDCGPT